MTHPDDRTDKELAQEINRYRAANPEKYQPQHNGPGRPPAIQQRSVFVWRSGLDGKYREFVGGPAVDLRKVARKLGV